MAAKYSRQHCAEMALHWVAYQLGRSGLSTLPTSRNAAGADLFVYGDDCAIALGVQVKGRQTRADVPLGHDLGKIKGAFWVIASNVGSDSPVCYVLTPDEVKSQAIRDNNPSKGTGKHHYWLKPSAFEQEQFVEAWERIVRAIKLQADDVGV